MRTASEMDRLCIIHADRVVVRAWVNGRWNEASYVASEMGLPVDSLVGTLLLSAQHIEGGEKLLFYRAAEIDGHVWLTLVSKEERRALLDKARTTPAPVRQGKSVRAVAPEGRAGASPGVDVEASPGSVL